MIYEITRGAKKKRKSAGRKREYKFPQRETKSSRESRASRILLLRLYIVIPEEILERAGFRAYIYTGSCSRISLSHLLLAQNFISRRLSLYTFSNLYIFAPNRFLPSFLPSPLLSLFSDAGARRLCSPFYFLLLRRFFRAHLARYMPRSCAARRFLTELFITLGDCRAPDKFSERARNLPRSRALKLRI